YKELGDRQLLDDEARKEGKSAIEELDKIKSKIGDLENGKIRALYEPLVLKYMKRREISINLGQVYTVEVVRNGLTGQDKSKLGLFFFKENNGNYVSITNDDLSWTRGEDLYHKQIKSELEKVQVDQMAMENLSLK
ncbi:MAG: hypothetical protein ACR5K5_05540, partial [Wolbachia sp.]